MVIQSTKESHLLKRELLEPLTFQAEILFLCVMRGRASAQVIGPSALVSVINISYSLMNFLLLTFLKRNLSGSMPSCLVAKVKQLLHWPLD